MDHLSCLTKTNVSNLLRIGMPSMQYDTQLLCLHIDAVFCSTAVNEKSKLEYRRDECYPTIDINRYSSLLQVSANNRSLSQGKLLHTRILITGLNQNIYLGAKLASMYAICGRMADARCVFDRLSERNAFLYNVMIRGYACNGLCEEALALYYQMLRAGIQPDNFTFPPVLKACAALSAMQEGREIHYQIVISGFESDVFVGNALVAMYAKCGKIEVARHVFDRMPKRNVVSWNALVAGYGQNGNAFEALRLFNQMQRSGVKPNLITIVSALRACAHSASLQQGKGIHRYIIENEFELDVFVETALIDMYAKCGSIEVARQWFDKMYSRAVVLWNAMIAGYVQNGLANEALTLFHQMQLENVNPDQATIVTVLSACADAAALQQGKDIHDYVIKNKLESDVSVANALVTMYSKCGREEVAWQLFDKMSERNVISWNAMISGFVQNGNTNKALKLLQQMQTASVKPNQVTIVSMLQGCAHFTVLQHAKWIHGYTIRNEFQADVFVGTALIDTYAKCGNVEISRQLFDKMCKRDVAVWNAMIAGYGMHGYGDNALALFSQMQQTGTKPDRITFTCVLCACSHAGLVNEGWKCFDCMSQDYCITPGVDHYACMVDLFGRAGRLDDAEDFIKKMPVQPNAHVWGALLAACRIHCNIELGEQVAECLFDLEPGNAGNYILLSNIYAANGRWDDVAKIRTMMKAKGLSKTPGCSLIEVKNRIHAFLVGDASHPQTEEIYATLEVLAGQMEAAGYVPNINFVLHDVEEEVKENMLYSHSEKLAIAFGLINASPKNSYPDHKELLSE